MAAIESFYLSRVLKKYKKSVVEQFKKDSPRSPFAILSLAFLPLTLSTKESKTMEGNRKFFLV